MQRNDWELENHARHQRQRAEAEAKRERQLREVGDCPGRIEAAARDLAARLVAWASGRPAAPAPERRRRPVCGYPAPSHRG